jgi:hypothetical protein
VCAQPIEFDEELFIEFDPALWVRIDLDHPTLHTVGIELLVPRRVKRVGEIKALAVAADLDHLRAAVEGLGWLLRVSCSAHDATEVN